MLTTSEYYSKNSHSIWMSHCGWQSQSPEQKEPEIASRLVAVSPGSMRGYVFLPGSEWICQIPVMRYTAWLCTLLKLQQGWARHTGLVFHRLLEYKGQCVKWIQATYFALQVWALRQVPLESRTLERRDLLAPLSLHSPVWTRTRVSLCSDKPAGLL